jgi:alkanesulfonate monooxygenase SsuD/methylene tetrahydromethanopterin reductase-like flavin-dependent oxidoreductase (luciferase family)
MATFLTGHEDAKILYDAYRAYFRPEAGGNGSSGDGTAPADRFAYLALTCVGETDELGLQGVRKIMWYLHANKIAPQFRNPPGYASLAASVRVLRGGQLRARVPVNEAPAEELIDRGVVFAGNPDSVYAQIKRFSDHVGGLGNLLIMGQGGMLSHEETVSNLTLFAKEVAPRLRELSGTV